MKKLLELFQGLSLRTNPLYLVQGRNGGVHRFCYCLEDAKEWAACGLLDEIVTITLIGCFTNKQYGMYRVVRNPVTPTTRKLARIL